MSTPSPACPHCGAKLNEGGSCPNCQPESEKETRSLTTLEQGAEEGARFGPYRIQRTLGEGGMGTVYLAEQREPIHRYVALKVIKEGLDSRAVIARFESERQALALMDHPNIARVLDAGADHGVPYFAMEYVRGMPITEFCDRHRLNTRQRLEIFYDVCNAIHHAHQRGVIHRDIKPSNVLVEMVDGKPLPKVIDFGVAKATHQRLTERTLFTQVGVMVGTPAYMSPEQAGGADVDVDITTDVYSLGVLLYELLVGAVPFDAKEMRQIGFAEMVRIIREVEPPKPSERLRSSGQKAVEVARLRATNVQMLHKELRGDLEFITMRALEKESARRYPSASEFAADIVRHLRDEPVEARPPDPVYRLRKFARRHKAPIAAAVAVALSIMAGLVTSTVLYLRSERERAEALRMSYVANLGAAGLSLRLEDVSAAQNRLMRAEPGLRGFEWGLLWRRSDPSIATLYTDSLFTGAAASQAGFAFSTDGRRIYWGLGDGVHVWDSSTYDPLQVYGGFGSLVAIGRDGTQVLASKPGAVSLIDLASGTVRASVDVPAEGDRLTGADLSPSGGQIAIATFRGRFRVWDVASARDLVDVKPEQKQPEPGSIQITKIAFQQNGQLVAGLSFDGTVRVWDWKTARLVMKGDIGEQAGLYGSLDFAPDGSRIAVGGASSVRVLDVKSGKLLLTLPGHPGGAAAVKFSPDGSLIASTARLAAWVRLWKASSGEQIGSLLGESIRGLIRSLAFSPDGRLLFAGSSDGEARIWDVATVGGQILGHTPHPFSSIALSPDGSRIAVTRPGGVEIWDAITGAKMSSWKTGPDKQCYGETCFTSFFGPLIFNFESVAFSPDGAQIATASRDGSSTLWDSRSGAEIRVLRGHQSAVTAVAFDESGARLASGSWDRTVTVWDLRSGSALNKIQAEAPVVSLAFTPAGDGLMVACGNPTHPADPESLVSMWKPAGGGAPIRQYRLPPGVTKTWGAALSHDGKLVAAATPGGVFVWDARTGQMVGSAYAGDTSEPSSIAFSADGRRLVAGTVTGGLRVFDNSGSELSSLPGGGSFLRSVVFSPDGGRVYATDENSDVQVWDGRSAYVPGAAEMVNPLRETLVRWSEVAARIQSDRGLDPKLRRAALELARRRGDDTGKWNRETRSVLLNPNRKATEYQEALRSATAALRVYPWSPDLMTTLGTAQYRTGRYREALQSLTRSESLRGFPYVIDQILMAICHAKLGEMDEASKELEAAVPIRSRMAGAQPPFLNEADGLIPRAASGQ